MEDKMKMDIYLSLTSYYIYIMMYLKSSYYNNNNLASIK